MNNNLDYVELLRKYRDGTLPLNHWDENPDAFEKFRQYLMGN